MRSGIAIRAAMTSTVLAAAAPCLGDLAVVGDQRAAHTEARVRDGGRVLAEQIDDVPIPLDIGIWGSGGVGYASAGAAPPEAPGVTAFAGAYQGSGWTEGAAVDYPNLLFASARCRAISGATGDGALIVESVAASTFEVTFVVDIPSSLQYGLTVESVEDDVALAPAGEATVELREAGGAVVLSAQLTAPGLVSDNDTIPIPAGTYTLTVVAQRGLEGAVAGSTRGESLAACSIVVNPEIPSTATVARTDRVPRALSQLDGAPPVLTVVADDRVVSGDAFTVCVDGETGDAESLSPPVQPSPRAWSAAASAQAIGVRPVVVTNLASQRSAAGDHGLLFAEAFAAQDYTRFPPASGYCGGLGEGLSRYDVTFETTTPQVYRLKSFLATAVDVGPGVPGGWAEVRLERVEGETLIDEQVGLFGGLTSSRSDHLFGTLAPGTWHLHTEAFRYGGVVNNGSTSHGESYSSVLMRVGRLAYDLDDDGVIGIAEFLAVLGAWGPCAGCGPDECPADLDGDCAVGVTEFLLILGNWG